ncbi:unnamed protein product [Orchesella dallaii]|uniref:Major facilitator superfamily (MFS) profile domain-containing protein n=1 Tax=Orchesella dallaii TaxID=48710 RepID=A0ABP1PS16_9HEXA
MIPEDSVKPGSTDRKPSGWGTRHTVIAMGFWGFAMSYAMRVNLSIAIVAMVRRNDSIPTPPHPAPHLTYTGLPLRDFSTEFRNTSGPACPTSTPIHHGEAAAIFDEDPGEFNWNEVEQGIILGSFFYGYMLTQLPGGIISQKYGGKWPLGLGIFITAVFALLTPIAARTHVSLLIIARIVQGLGEGLCTPAMHNLLGNWAPPQERGFMAGVTYSGTSFGTAVTLIFSGYIIHGGVLGGWPGIFYICGIISVLWFVLWCFLVYDTPAAHPRISGDELYYIQSSIGSQVSKVREAVEDNL